MASQRASRRMDLETSKDVVWRRPSAIWEFMWWWFARHRSAIPSEWAREGGRMSQHNMDNRPNGLDKFYGPLDLRAFLLWIAFLTLFLAFMLQTFNVRWLTVELRELELESQRIETPKAPKPQSQWRGQTRPGDWSGWKVGLPYRQWPWSGCGELGRTVDPARQSVGWRRCDGRSVGRDLVVVGSIQSGSCRASEGVALRFQNRGTYLWRFPETVAQEQPHGNRKEAA